MSPRVVLGGTAALALGVVGCADVLGFKSFQEEPGGVASDGGAPLDATTSTGADSSSTGPVEAGGSEGGPSGASCDPGCGTGQACQNGTCVCDPTTCTGCCSGTACSMSWPGCGVGGGACAGCDSRSDRCDATGGCACGMGGACAAGLKCDGGACTCDPGSCNGACCGNSCVQLATDGTHCGSCDHSCLGGTCAGSQCVPTTLSTGGNPGWRMVLSPTTVYWLSSAGVYSCPLTGCGAKPAGPFTLAGYGFTSMDTIAYVDNGTLSRVYVGGEEITSNAKEVFEMLPDGTSFTLFQQNLGGAWFVDTGSIYWSTGTDLEKRGLKNTLQSIVMTSIDAATVIGEDTNNIYLSDSAGLLGCSTPSSGCGATSKVLASTTASDMLFIATEPDSNYVYFANYTFIYRCPYLGCGDPANLTQWTGKVGDIGGMVSDANFLYWTDENSGSVLKCAHGDTCATPTVIASGLNDPWGIAVDDTWVYWTLGNGTTPLQRAPK